MSMKCRISVFLGVLIVGWVSVSHAQSNLYKMRNGAVVTPMGQELIDVTNTFCAKFSQLQGHAAAMVRQRDDTNDYTTVAVQWGVVDVTTNAPSEPAAEALHSELNSMTGNTQAAILQFCASVKQ